MQYADQQHAAPEASAWIGGQGTLPKEQKTQQWPLFGRSRTPQPLQSYKNWQESVGMVSIAACPHFGQVIVDCRIGAMSGIEITGDQQHNADDEADERQETHDGRRAHSIRPACRRKTLLPPQQDRTSSKRKGSEHQKQGPDRRCDRRYPPQPSGAEAQTDHQQWKRATGSDAERGSEAAER